MCNLDEAIDKMKILEKQKTEQDDEVCDFIYVSSHHKNIPIQF